MALGLDECVAPALGGEAVAGLSLGEGVALPPARPPEGEPLCVVLGVGVCVASCCEGEAEVEPLMVVEREGLALELGVALGEGEGDALVVAVALTLTLLLACVDTVPHRDAVEEAEAVGHMDAVAEELPRTLLVGH